MRIPSYGSPFWDTVPFEGLTLIEATHKRLGLGVPDEPGLWPTVRQARQRNERMLDRVAHELDLDDASGLDPYETERHLRWLDHLEVI